MKNNARNSSLASFLLLALVSSTACAQSGTAAPATAPSTSGTVAGGLVTVQTPSSRAAIAKFYAERANEAAFVRNGYATQLVQELKQAIETVAPAHGLPASYYWTPALEALSYQSILPASAEFEFAKAYVDLAMHIATGRLTPTEIANDIKYSRQPFTAYAALNAGVTNLGLRYALESVAPKHDLYRRLQAGLARMRSIEAQGGFARIAPAKARINVGGSNPIVPQLKARAAQMGYYVANMDQTLDSQFVAVLNDIEDNSGAGRTKSYLGPGDLGTWSYFAFSSAERIQQIELNLEKLRWLPNQLEARHIFVNLSTQYLYVKDPGLMNPALAEMRIINGHIQRKTPSMRDETLDVVLNPTWTVPPTIFAQDKSTELSSILQTEGQWGVQSWFDRGQYTVVNSTTRQQMSPMSIDWVNLNPKTADFLIIQRPNYMNALGVTKIMLKNPWAIYMHDTNQRELFVEKKRALSSGCMRLEDPISMVEYLLRGTKWDRFAIEDFVAKPGESRDKDTWIRIPQANRLPIYTMLLTTHVGNDNVLRFSQDVYRQNPAVLEKLKAGGFIR